MYKVFSFLNTFSRILTRNIGIKKISLRSAHATSRAIPKSSIELRRIDPITTFNTHSSFSHNNNNHDDVTHSIQDSSWVRQLLNDDDNTDIFDQFMEWIDEVYAEMEWDQNEDDDTHDTSSQL